MRSITYAAMIFAFAAAGCGRGGSEAARLTAGGATFVNPIMQLWKDKYNTAANVQVDYKATGSGNGIQQMTGKVYDFGCTDAPMNKEETETAKTEGGEVIHVPVIMGAVAMVYNVPGVPNHLVLSGDVVAKIYLGEITAWNDPAIAALNPGVNLPATGLTPVYRAESSGTSSVFTEYLSKSSESFKAKVGISKNPKWPKIGTGQQGNDGVAGHVKRNEGCIGYVEMYYAKTSELNYATLKNRRGKNVLPDPDNVAAAAAAALTTPATVEPYTLHQLTFSLTDVDSDLAYPICGASYAVLYKNQPAGKGKALVAFIKWATTEGQEFAKELHYSPLPPELRAKIGARLDEVKLD